MNYVFVLELLINAHDGINNNSHWQYAARHKYCELLLEFSYLRLSLVPAQAEQICHLFLH